MPTLSRVVISEAPLADGGDMGAILDNGDNECDPADTCCDDVCFWLYSSGSTGLPKGTVHCHSALIQTAELYARPTLGLSQRDRTFSAAKLFFAYGLGNALTFPMAVGEALPEKIGQRFTQVTGVEILDGIGSTEMLHIFLSNRRSQVRYGTTGVVVPGYQLRLLGEDGEEVATGEVGDLYIKGPTSALYYWNQREKTRQTFQGEWTRSGDKYVQSADGYYTYAGRSDDMLKVSGQFVSPFEVESAIGTHDAVLEAAVIGLQDVDELVKPKAFVVLQQGVRPSDELAETLKQHVKQTLAPFKYPRWIEFVDELPKTATGKIQRFRLRADR
jgi:benzoate-CoA ligase